MSHFDPINGNIRVEQPDDNGLYTWVRIRAGHSDPSQFSSIEMKGDLDMDGHTIKDAVFDPPIGGGGGPVTLGDLTDVDLVTVLPEPGSGIKYDAGGPAWIVTDLGTEARLDELNDVAIDNLLDTQRLVYDAGEWINENVPPAGAPASVLNDLTDVNAIASSGNVLHREGGEWIGSARAINANSLTDVVAQPFPFQPQPGHVLHYDGVSWTNGILGPIQGEYDAIVVGSGGDNARTFDTLGAAIGNPSRTNIYIKSNLSGGDLLLVHNVSYTFTFAPGVTSSITVSKNIGPSTVTVHGGSFSSATPFNVGPKLRCFGSRFTGAPSFGYTQGEIDEAVFDGCRFDGPVQALGRDVTFRHCSVNGRLTFQLSENEKGLTVTECDIPATLEVAPETGQTHTLRGALISKNTGGGTLELELSCQDCVVSDNSFDVIELSHIAPDQVDYKRCVIANNTGTSILTQGGPTRILVTDSVVRGNFAEDITLAHNCNGTKIVGNKCLQMEIGNLSFPVERLSICDNSVTNTLNLSSTNFKDSIISGNNGNAVINMGEDTVICENVIVSNNRLQFDDFKRFTSCAFIKNTVGGAEWSFSVAPATDCAFNGNVFLSGNLDFTGTVGPNRTVFCGNFLQAPSKVTADPGRGTFETIVSGHLSKSTFDNFDPDELTYNRTV